MSAPAPRSKTRRLSRNVYIVSLVSFCQDTASDLLYPVLPIFITTVLGARPNDADAAWAYLRAQQALRSATEINVVLSTSAPELELT